MSALTPNGDTLYGVATIARFVGRPELEVQRLVDIGYLPAFKLGKLICASKAKLREWRANRDLMVEGQS
jgi:hypothetical protein